MVEPSPESSAQLHIITYLHWLREGRHTFDTQRAKLLDILAQLLEEMQADAETSELEHIVLGGQTIILDDIASISGNLLELLLDYSRVGRLSLGPWYVHLDGLMADGEALVRSLLLGRADARRHGIQTTKVAFMPETCQNVAQLPQILRNFDIDAAFLCLGNSVMQLPFRWEAPDGSSVLVMTYQERENIKLSILKQRAGQPDGPFLWMHRIVSPESLSPATLVEEAEIPDLQSTLEVYTAAVREMLPDDLRPSVKGELHLQKNAQTMGRFSACIIHKQDIARLQSRIAYLAEPLLALALTHGRTRFPEIQRALLEYSWRSLMQNMSRQTFAGAVSDAVYDEMIIRNRRVDDNSQRVVEAALEGLPGKPLKSGNRPSAGEEIYITVWNPHGHPVTQVVELAIRLPAGKHPNILLDPDEEELAFSWDDETQTLGFRASVDSIGYAVYTLKLSQEKTAAYNQKRTVAGRAIGSASGETLGLVSGHLDWTLDSINISDLLSFHDGGDAGSIWEYQEPQPDVLMRASIVDIAQVEATPTYERLIFRNRMRIAPGLKEGKERERGLRVLDLMSTATYYNDLPGVHFQTTFSNSAEDHRLRAHIRTDIDASAIYSDTAFGLIKRPVEQIAAAGEQAMQSLAALYTQQRGLALFTRGLSAVEALHEEKQITLALTLLRAVGKLDKQGRTAIAQGQLPGDHHAEFMLMPVDPQRDLSTLLRTSLTYRAPLCAVQYEEQPPDKAHSYLQLDTDKVVMTALKPPQEGKGIIIRLLNAGRARTEVSLRPDRSLIAVAQSNLAEVKQADLHVEKHQVTLSLEPHQIVTLHLEF